MGEAKKKKLSDKILDWIEKSGNILPDPAILFFAGLIIVWVLSAFFSGIVFTEIDPRSGENLKVVNLLNGREIANFFATMVQRFIYFAPLGVVLVAVLGVGVAEQSGFVNTGLKILLKITPKKFITPMVLIVGIASHSAADAGYVLIVPLAGIIYYSAGRHPLAGIAVANAGIAGGFRRTINFIQRPSYAGFDSFYFCSICSSWYHIRIYGRHFFRLFLCLRLLQ